MISENPESGNENSNEIENDVELLFGSDDFNWSDYIDTSFTDFADLDLSNMLPNVSEIVGQNGENNTPDGMLSTPVAIRKDMDENRLFDGGTIQDEVVVRPSGSEVCSRFFYCGPRKRKIDCHQNEKLQIVGLRMIMTHTNLCSSW